MLITEILSHTTLRGGGWKIRRFHVTLLLSRNLFTLCLLSITPEGSFGGPKQFCRLRVCIDLFVCTLVQETLSFAYISLRSPKHGNSIMGANSQDKERLDCYPTIFWRCYYVDSMWHYQDRLAKKNGVLVHTPNYQPKILEDYGRADPKYYSQWCSMVPFIKECQTISLP